MNSLDDPALWVLPINIGKSKNELVKFDERHASKFTASKSSRMSKLVYVRCTSLCNEVAKVIDRCSGVFEQSRLMETILEDTVAIGILIPSVAVSELALVTTLIKTVFKRDLD